tara:strand:- start:1019 stop:1954 length:936 start_codon:yes stop_codon:yes gene_type:complete
MVELTFTNPVYLWFFLSIPALGVMHYVGIKLTRVRAIEFANFAALKRVAKNPFLPKNYILLLLRILTLSFLILAISGTVLWYFGKSSDFDFILAIDSSSSMLAGDFLPSRLNVAVETAKNFLGSISSKAKIGIVSFAGTSFVEQKPTDDFSEVIAGLDKISIKTVGGTDLGEAIITSSNLLLEGDKAKVVILITDGRSNVGVPIQQAIDYANSNYITVHTIGIGTEEGGILPETDIVLKLDEEELKSIAASTNGVYYRAADKEALEKTYDEIISSTEEKISVNLSIPFMLLALILLFLDWGLINTKYGIIP